MSVCDLPSGQSFHCVDVQLISAPRPTTHVVSWFTGLSRLM